MKVTRAAQCLFFTEAAAVRMAIKAYRAASFEAQPPAHEPFIVDGAPWSSPAIWAQEFIRCMHVQVESIGIARQIPWDTGSVLSEFGWELNNEHNVPELRLVMNSLRPLDNPAHNQSGTESDNG